MPAGAGGATAVLHLDNRLTITYMMNEMNERILGSPRAEACIRAVSAARG